MKKNDGNVIRNMYKQQKGSKRVKNGNGPWNAKNNGNMSNANTASTESYGTKVDKIEKYMGTTSVSSVPFIYATYTPIPKLMANTLRSVPLRVGVQPGLPINLYQANVMNFLVQQNAGFEVGKMSSVYSRLYVTMSARRQKQLLFDPKALAQYTHLLQNLFSLYSYFERQLAIGEYVVFNNPGVPKQFQTVATDWTINTIHTAMVLGQENATFNAYYPGTYTPCHYTDDLANTLISLENLRRALNLLPDPTHVKERSYNLFRYFFKDSEEMNSSYYAFQPLFIGLPQFDGNDISYVDRAFPTTGVQLTSYLDNLTKAITSLNTEYLNVRNELLNIAEDLALNYQIPEYDAAKLFVYDYTILQSINSMTMGLIPDQYTSDGVYTNPETRFRAFGAMENGFADHRANMTSASLISDTLWMSNFYHDDITDADAIAAARFAVMRPTNFKVDYALNYSWPLETIAAANIVYGSPSGDVTTVSYYGAASAYLNPRVILSNSTITGDGYVISNDDAQSTDTENKLRYFMQLNSLVGQFDYHPINFQSICVGLQFQNASNLASLKVDSPYPLPDVDDGYLFANQPQFKSAIHETGTVILESAQTLRMVRDYDISTTLVKPLLAAVSRDFKEYNN